MVRVSFTANLTSEQIKEADAKFYRHRNWLRKQTIIDAERTLRRINNDLEEFTNPLQNLPRNVADYLRLKAKILANKPVGVRRMTALQSATLAARLQHYGVTLEVAQQIFSKSCIANRLPKDEAESAIIAGWDLGTTNNPIDLTLFVTDNQFKAALRFLREFKIENYELFGKIENEIHIFGVIRILGRLPERISDQIYQFFPVDLHTRAGEKLFLKVFTYITNRDNHFQQHLYELAKETINFPPINIKRKDQKKIFAEVCNHITRRIALEHQALLESEHHGTTTCIYSHQSLKFSIDQERATKNEEPVSLRAISNALKILNLSPHFEIKSGREGYYKRATLITIKNWNPVIPAPYCKVSEWLEPFVDILYETHLDENRRSERNQKAREETKQQRASEAKPLAHSCVYIHASCNEACSSTSNEVQKDSSPEEKQQINDELHVLLCNWKRCTHDSHIREPVHTVFSTSTVRRRQQTLQELNELLGL